GKCVFACSVDCTAVAGNRVVEAGPTLGIFDAIAAGHVPCPERGLSFRVLLLPSLLFRFGSGEKISVNGAADQERLDDFLPLRPDVDDSLMPVVGSLVLCRAVRPHVASHI